MCALSAPPVCALQVLGRLTANGFTSLRKRATSSIFGVSGFPMEQPEQVTFSNTTEEEGVAMAPNGKSFITSVGTHDSMVWIHDQNGEHPTSSEGEAGRVIASGARTNKDGQRQRFRRTARSFITCGLRVRQLSPNCGSESSPRGRRSESCPVIQWMSSIFTGRKTGRFLRCGSDRSSEPMGRTYRS